jgi:pimeloyl-ACP methyl ester carboxylesterase
MRVRLVSSIVSGIFPAALLAVLGGAAVSAQDASQPIPPPGRLVDVGGHLVHINCTGKGSPTVVLESGSGDFSLVWDLVQPAVAQLSRVCSYDRAGYAWSDPGPQPRTMAQIVFELHALLAAVGEKGPYVLVGASLGGPTVRVFANTFPSDSSGMVLVDSIHEDGFSFLNDKMIRVRETSRRRQIPPVQTTLKLDPAAREPLVMKPTRFTTLVEGNPRSRLPPDLQRIWMVARKQDKYTYARSGEFEFLPEELDKLHADTLAAGQPLGNRPLIVLTRDVAFDRTIQGKPPGELDRDRKDLQAQLAKLSANSKFVVVQNSGSEIHLDQPQAVIEAIREVIDSARTGTPLK